MNYYKKGFDISLVNSIDKYLKNYASNKNDVF